MGFLPWFCALGMPLVMPWLPYLRSYTQPAEIIGRNLEMADANKHQKPGRGFEAAVLPRHCLAYGNNWQKFGCARREQALQARLAITSASFQLLFPGRWKYLRALREWQTYAWLAEIIGRNSEMPDANKPPNSG